MTLYSKALEFPNYVNVFCSSSTLWFSLPIQLLFPIMWDFVLNVIIVMEIGSLVTLFYYEDLYSTLIILFC